MSSQVSGKSGKTNGSHTSPVLRQKRIEEEMAPQTSQKKDKKLRLSHKENEVGKDRNDVEINDNKLENGNNIMAVENHGIFKDDISRSDLDHHLKTDLLAPIPKDKPESTVTSYQEEFPSAAATEDSNSFASRAEDSPGIEGEFVEQDFPTVSPRYEISGMKQSIGDKHTINHFNDDANVCSDGIGKHGGSLIKENLLEMLAPGGRGKTWQNPHREELDAMFAPLQKSKLKSYMQEKTSVMEKVGMWLEEQNGYSKDERLSSSHGDIDRIDKANLHGYPRFDNPLVKYSTISTSSSPFKKSGVRNGVENFSLQQFRWPNISGQLTLETSGKGANEIANDPSIYDIVGTHEQEDSRKEKLHNVVSESFKRIRNEVNMELALGKDRREVKSMTELSTNFKDIAHGVGSYSLPEGEYNGNILLDESNNFR